MENFRKHAKITAVALLLAVLAGFFQGCGNASGDRPVDDIHPEDADQEYVDSLTGIAKIRYERSLVRDKVPQLDFRGEKFAVMLLEYSTGWWAPEEQTGDSLNDAIYNTKQYTEDRLNVKLMYTLEDTTQKVYDLIAMGDSTYSAITAPFNRMGMFAADGMLLDWSGIPYIDLDAAWWNQSAREAIEVRGRNYLMVGAANIEEVRVTYCVYFNKDLAEQYSTVLPDLYELVDNGEWTMDKFIELSRIGYVDLNGNQKADQYDQFGLAAQTSSYAVPFLYSCGELTTARDENGIPYISVNTEKVASIAEKTYELIYGNPAVFPTYDWSTHSDIFVEGRALFMYGTFTHALSHFREMQDRYGFLPYPKYDEFQKEYRTCPDPSGSTFGIAMNCRDTEMTGAVMEVLNSRAWQDEQPALYDAALKGRAADTEDDARMIDIIVKGITYDFGYIFGGPGELLSKMMTHKTKDFASQYRSRIRQWEENINNAVEQILESQY